jgi:hypothetical protein
MAMDIKMKQSAVIEFLLLEKSNDKEITQRLRNIYGDGVNSHATILQ